MGAARGVPAAGALTTVTGGAVRGAGATGVVGGNAEPRSRAWCQHTHFHRRRPCLQHVEFGRGGVRQVDDAIPDERTA